MSELRYAPISLLRRVRALEPGPARTALFADLCRLNVLYMVAFAGSGHLGTSFSCLDVVSQLYLDELRTDGPERDLYFSSKGHDAPALYAVLCALERLDPSLLHRLRKLGGLPGHPDVSVPGVETNTGSLGMGISKAKGMALARRLRGERGRVFVLTGDGELQEGQLWESLGSAVRLGLSEITLIVDHNRLQSDTFVSDVSDLGDLEAKFRSFGWSALRCDGHDPAAIAAALGIARALQPAPTAIIADTIKGRGVSFMEVHRRGELYGYHSGAPSPADYDKAAQEIEERVAAALERLGAGPLELLRVARPAPAAPPPGRVERLIPAYASALIEEGERNPGLVVLDADLVKDTGLVAFRERFPERFFECGIAEQDMVSMAGGMARQGLLPVVHSFACFLSMRPNEQIWNNATERTRIVYVGSLAGLVPGGPGHSHQAVRDIAALSAVPGLAALEPCCEREVGLALAWCANVWEGPSYLRLVSIPCALPFELPSDYALERGRGVSLTHGRDAILFGHGPVVLAEAVHAAARLAQRGIRLEVVNLPWLNHVDDAWLARSIAGRPLAISLENHFVRGGQGDALADAIARGPERTRLLRLGVRDIPVCGTNDEVLHAHALDAASLALSIEAALRP